MKKVYICSRYRADEKHTVADNISRAVSACGHALRKGYAPIAPHLMYPRCLDDSDPDDRKVGTDAALEWIAACDELWQYGATVSEGMKAEIDRAHELWIPVKVFNGIGIPQEHWNQDVKFISYDGKYPNLCNGVLTFSVDGEVRTTSRNALKSGGGNRPNTFKGDWQLYEDEPAFADLSKRSLSYLIAEVNDNITERGCCGGCQ
jgi:hypothetical protein